MAASTPTTGEKHELARKGHAMPDGSFYIRDIDDLDNAIRAVGRARHIKSVAGLDGGGIGGRGTAHRTAPGREVLGRSGDGRQSA